MANRTLRYASTGDDVRKLQEGLNLMPSQLPKLVEDGIYGAKTTQRVREFQRSNALTPDGVAGPATWEGFLQLLAQLQSAAVPAVQSAAIDVLRPAVLMIAQQHLGMVDFSVKIGGKPKGLDFLIKMYQVAAGQTVPEEAFKKEYKDKKGNSFIDWYQEPLLFGQRKSWCGIFCVYCYRLASVPVSWNMAIGRPVGPLKLNSWSPQFAQGIKQADMGCVASKSHHFLIESVDSGSKLPRLTTIDGNQDYGRILRVWSADAKAHQVGKDNFNYYSF